MDIETKYSNINVGFKELYDNNVESLKAFGNQHVNSERSIAYEAFRKRGIPKFRTEDYKYTDLERGFNKDLKYLFEPSRLKIPMEELFRCDIPNLDADVYMVLNGFYYNDKELITELENGVILGSFAEAVKKFPHLINKYYNKIADNNNQGLVALNTAFVQDGFFLYVPDNVVIDKPLQLINIGLSDESRIVQFRNLIIAGKNSSFNLVICDHSLSPVDFLTNSVSEIFAGKNSNVDIVNVQNEHNGCTQITNGFVKQEQNSSVKKNTVTLHGGLVRNNLKMELAGEGAHAEAVGLYITDGVQHVDNQTIIEHRAPRCTSSQLYKGILDDKSTAAFNGKIHVLKDAQQTVAYQKNNNIQLTSDAKMKTKPQLEIYADDVKCSHGATVGQLDNDAIFYMRARGIDKKEARLLMMFAFANEVVSKINIEALSERIEDLVNQRLRGELSRCHSCPINCC
jgi:Fe-S cluster assembly protein SufD